MTPAAMTSQYTDLSNALGRGRWAMITGHLGCRLPLEEDTYTVV